MMKELQFYFPKPGKWGEFILTAIFPDADGFVQNQRYRPRDLSADQLEAFSEVVAVIAVLSDEWKAVQAWARLAPVVADFSTADGEGAVKVIEEVILTVEAVNLHGARKLFTRADYPEFTIPGKAAAAFFRQLTESPCISA